MEHKACSAVSLPSCPCVRKTQCCMCSYSATYQKSCTEKSQFMLLAQRQGKKSETPCLSSYPPHGKINTEQECLNEMNETEFQKVSRSYIVVFAERVQCRESNLWIERSLASLPC